MRSYNNIRFIVLSFFCLFSFFMIASSVYAIDVNSDPSCSDTPEGSQPYCTIQAAIDATSNGNTIVVAPGTYTQNVVVENKENIIIKGTGDSTNIVPSSGIGFAIKNSNNITLINFKIHTTGTDAHGIWVAGSSNGKNAMNNLTVQDTTVVVDGYSGGIYAAHSSPAHSNWIIGGINHGNHITINSGAGVTGDGLDLYDVSDSEVSYNDITLNNPTDSTNVLWFSELSNLNNIVFKNNTVSGSSGSEVAIVTDFIETLPDTSISTVKIEGNTFSNWGSRAIKVGTASGTGSVTGVSINSNTFKMTADTAEVIGGTAASSATGTGNTFNVSVPAKIQKAINNALPGDTINVAEGKYVESLIVNKTLSIIGVGNTVTVIEPNQNSDGITITANSVLIKNFNISTSNTGVSPNIAISIKETDGVEINNNIIETTGNKAMGIWVGGSSNSLTPSTNFKIRKNTITINGVATGIYAAHSNVVHSGWIIGGSTENANIITAASSNPIELYDVSDSEVSYNSLKITAPADASNIIWSSELSDISNLILKSNMIDGSSGSEVAFVTDFIETSPDTTSSSVTITNNTFKNWGSRGLKIGDRVSGVNVTSNKFLSAGEMLRNEYITVEVNAKKNYWNSKEPNFTSVTSGNVSYSPWYTDSSLTILISSLPEDDQELAENETVIVGNDTNEIIFPVGSPLTNVTVNSSISQDKEINISLSDLINSTGDVSLVNDFILRRETSTATYSAEIPTGTVISGGTGWDGKISLPTIKVSGDYSVSSGSTDVVVDMGSSSEINFSKPVKVIIGGMAGKKAAWTRGTNSLTVIETACDNITNPTNIDTTSTRECYGDSGSDLIIWTTHFTTFAAYTPSSTSTGGSSGTGSSGGKIRSNIVISKEPIKEEVKETSVVEPVKETPEVAPTPLVQQTQPQEEPGFFDSLTGAVTGAGTKEIIGSLIALGIVVVGVSGYMFIRKRKKI